MVTEHRPPPVRVVAPDGVEYLITVEPAPKLGGWLNGPWRWWSTLTRDSSWWLTVESSAVGWPVLRRRYRSADDAAKGCARLCQAIARGGWSPPKRLPLRRYTPVFGGPVVLDYGPCDTCQRDYQRTGAGPWRQQESG